MCHGGHDLYLWNAVDVVLWRCLGWEANVEEITADRGSQGALLGGCGYFTSFTDYIFGLAEEVGGGVLDKRSSGDTREGTSLPFTGENSASCFLYKFAFRQKLTFKCLSQKQYHSFTNHSGIEKFTCVLSLLTTFSILLFFSSIHLYFYRVVTKEM